MTKMAAINGTACLVSLSGCQLMVEADWYPERTLPPLDPIHVEVAASQLPGLCSNQPGMLLYGCAKRDYTARVCVIYTERDPPQWLMDHERKHCAGWDHRTLRAAEMRRPVGDAASSKDGR